MQLQSAIFTGFLLGMPITRVLAASDVTASDVVVTVAPSTTEAPVIVTLTSTIPTTATPSPTSTSSASTSPSVPATPSSTAKPQKSSSIPQAGIIGAAVGGAIFLIALAAILVVVCRRRRRQQRIRKGVQDDFFNRRMSREPTIPTAALAPVDDVDRYAVGGRTKPMALVTAESRSASWSTDGQQIEPSDFPIGAAITKEIGGSVYPPARLAPESRTQSWAAAPPRPVGQAVTRSSTYGLARIPPITPGNARATASTYGRENIGGAVSAAYTGGNQEYVAYHPANLAAPPSTRQGSGFQSPEMHLWKPGDS